MNAYARSWYIAPRWWWPGGASALCLLALVVVPVVTLAVGFDWRSGTDVLGRPYTWRVVRFSFWQAALSTSLSLLAALPMAVALSRHCVFPGRMLLLRMFSMPLVMPTLVAITGVIVVYGNSGWLRAVLEVMAVKGDYVFYGLPAILLAHVFFNFPLATRVLLQAMDAIPSENWRLCDQLGIPPWSQFKLVEWPAIRLAIPGLVALIFSLCFTSFAVVLTLGGGPGASTIEVAVYQALRLDFDIPTAVVLACLQIAICATLLVLSTLVGRPTVIGGALRRYNGRTPTHSVFTFTTLVIGTLVVLLPLTAVAVRGIGIRTVPMLVDPTVMKATLLTAGLSLAAGACAVLVALGLLLSARHLRVRLARERAGRMLAGAGLLTLVVPGVVLSAGLFLLLHQYVDVFANAAWLIIAVNAMIGLPFACAVLAEPTLDVANRADRLCAMLGVFGLSRARLVEWPLLRRSIGLALGLCSALAAGDLTAVALFGSQDMQTLPSLLHQLLGSYRVSDASVVALLLLCVCLVLFTVSERICAGPIRAER
ncbi:MAG: thiamine/thiamine pyrophosphate ABC transporter, permease protein [Chromatiales bacterium]|nr:thiamine/thiamine pyrophosphate ABC transporter, permease protein [Chromatiales bacterium]